MPPQAPPPPAAPGDLDRTTLKAVAILAGAVEKCAGPSNMAAYALKAVLKTRTRPALDFAGRAFDMLEPRLRKNINRVAQETAVEFVKPRLPRFLAAPLQPTKWVVEHRTPPRKPGH